MLEVTGNTVLKEYRSLKKIVNNETPGIMVDDFTKCKKKGDGVEVCWSLGQASYAFDSITIWDNKKSKNGHDDFNVSYYHGKHILDEPRKVVRRIIGHGFHPLRVDTVDAKTGKLLEVQGMERLYLTSREMKLLSKWDIAGPKKGQIAKSQRGISQ